jgi:hypothetical protein
LRAGGGRAERDETEERAERQFFHWLNLRLRGGPRGGVRPTPLIVRGCFLDAPLPASAPGEPRAEAIVIVVSAACLPTVGSARLACAPRAASS